MTVTAATQMLRIVVASWLLVTGCSKDKPNRDFNNVEKQSEKSEDAGPGGEQAEPSDDNAGPNVSSVDIKAESDNSDTEVDPQLQLTFPQKPLLGNRHHVQSNLQRVFFSDEKKKDINKDINKKLWAYISKNVVFFGGPCNAKSHNCSGTPEANAAGNVISPPSAARAGYLITACSDMIKNPQAVTNVLSKLGLERRSPASKEKIKESIGFFLPGLAATEESVEAFENLFQDVKNKGGSHEEAWKLVFHTLCSASDDVITFRKSENVDDIQPVDIFERCYAQMTQDAFVLVKNDEMKSLHAKVRDGEVEAVDACMSVLSKADFKNGKIDPANPVGVAVLRNFHDLHSSWFRVRRIPDLTNGIQMNYGTRGVYDPQEPALYFTNALFDGEVEFREVMTSSDRLTAYRATMAPTTAGPDSGISTKEQILTKPYLAPRGRILGVQKNLNLVRKYSYKVKEKATNGTVNLGRHLGAGLLGAQGYLLTSIGVLAGYVADGGEKTLRQWARSVYNDLFCRQLPVVRQDDILDLVVKDSPLSFRTSKSCTVCHASSDQLGGVLRGTKIVDIGKVGMVPRWGLAQVRVDGPKPGLGSEKGWPATATENYRLRPPKGKIFFRTHAGELVDEPVANLVDFGEKASEMEAPYICLAKRYYEYFTGIDVNIGDINNPASAIALTERDQEHRDFVIKLGVDLKNHQDPKKVIRKIFESDFFQKAK